jgi:hypothetical protein
LDTAALIDFLQVVSPIAVIAGASLVVLQLRHSAREIKSNVALSLLERITDESFPRRRKNMHDVVRKYSENGWKDFDDSLDDYETRNFAYQYELIGQFVRAGLVDKKTVMDALQGLVVIDWRAFGPLDKHLAERYKSKVSPWRNFEALAKDTETYMVQQGMSV